MLELFNNYIYSFKSIIICFFILCHYTLKLTKYNPYSLTIQLYQIIILPTTLYGIKIKLNTSYYHPFNNFHILNI